jgi:hypothetical protein
LGERRHQEIEMTLGRDATLADASGPQPRPKLKILCVGTGRDGTQSLNHMIEHVFAGSGGERHSMHEYCCREFYQAFCDLKEIGDPSHADTIERMIAACPYDCIVGNGYAAILPLFAKHYGRDLKLVHLYRERDACIASLMTNCALFPTAYRYYAVSPDASVKRMAAFHFGEMSRAEWDRLPLADKFGWYYDKTHALVRQHASLFEAHIEIATESLDDEACRRTIAGFVGGDRATPPKTHLNASVIDIVSFARQHQVKMNWLMGRLNMEELANDDVYALNYFLDKYIAWTGYQITGAPQLGGAVPPPAQQVAADLERAARILENGLREVDALYKLVRSRGGEGTRQ